MANIMMKKVAYGVVYFGLSVMCISIVLIAGFAFFNVISALLNDGPSGGSAAQEGLFVALAPTWRAYSFLVGFKLILLGLTLFACTKAGESVVSKKLSELKFSIPVISEVLWHLGLMITLASVMLIIGSGLIDSIVAMSESLFPSDELLQHGASWIFYGLFCGILMLAVSLLLQVVMRLFNLDPVFQVNDR